MKREVDAIGMVLAAIAIVAICIGCAWLDRYVKKELVKEAIREMESELAK